MRLDYYKGFIDKCAEFGVDPNALVKLAQLAPPSPSLGPGSIPKRQPIAPTAAPNYRPANQRISLGTPMSDPSLKHLHGSATRRGVLETALGTDRANEYIRKSQDYYDKNPELFRSIYDPYTVDDNVRNVIGKPVRLDKQFRTNQFQLGSAGGAYIWPRSYMSHTQVPTIAALDGQPFTVMLHEYTHAGNPGIRSGDMRGVTSLQPWRHLPARFRNKSISDPSKMHPAAKNIHDATSYVYRGYRNSNPVDHHEIPTVLSELRVNLEQHGVDTTNPNKLKQALLSGGYEAFATGSGDELPYVDNRSQSRLNKYLGNIKDPAEKEKVVDDLVKIMQGIAQNPGGTINPNPSQAKYASINKRTNTGTNMSKLNQLYKQANRKLKLKSNLVKLAQPAGYIGVSNQSYLPIAEKRDFTKDELSRIDKEKNKLLPQFIISESDDPSILLGSPRKRGRLAGLLAGGYTGALTGGLTLLGDKGPAAALGIGALTGLPAGLLANALTRKSQEKQNETILDRIRRLPKGATLRDYEADPLLQARRERAAAMARSLVLGSIIAAK